MVVIVLSNFAEQAKHDTQSLEQKANDPIASLMSVQIQNLYSGDYHNLDNASSDTVLLRSAVPFKTGCLNHIARATLPIVAHSLSDDSGLGDMVLFDLVVFNQTWGVGHWPCCFISHSDRKIPGQ